jgi:hypothetical protein
MISFHYNYHRYYSPKLGRYIQSDPIGIAGGGNTYNYVENSISLLFYEKCFFSEVIPTRTLKISENIFDKDGSWKSLLGQRKYKP